MSEYITDTNIVELRRSRTTISTTPEFAWQDGASDIRDLYEAELSRLRQERDELVGALEKLTAWLEMPQMGTWQYMEGDGFYSDKNKHVWNARAVLSKHKTEQ